MKFIDKQIRVIAFANLTTAPESPTGEVPDTLVRLEPDRCILVRSEIDADDLRAFARHRIEADCASRNSSLCITGGIAQLETKRMIGGAAFGKWTADASVGLIEVPGIFERLE